MSLLERVSRALLKQKNDRMLILAFSLFMGYGVGYYWCALYGNPYVFNYLDNPAHGVVDYSMFVLSNNMNEDKVRRANTKIIRDAFLKKGELDVLGWLHLGTHYSGLMEEELSF